MFLLKTWRSTAFGIYGYMNFTKNGFLDHSKKFKPEDMQIQIQGKNCVVTGANSGIGYAAAEGLASRFELNYAVNVLGTYTMTELMLPLLEKASPDSKVITVSSGGMYTSPLTTDLQFSGEKFDGVLQYARNKRIQVALTEKWADKYKNKGIGFYSMHPGWAETPGVARSLPSFKESFSGKLRTSEEGADTVVWLALQPKEKLVSGAFYFDRAEAPKHLTLAGTSKSHDLIDSVIDTLHSMAALDP
ncbi:hypothetical protein DY000_02014881 [Brassica cretica]|uniref:Dehydrogenase/reductase SDR family member 12 n=1 Tax=Brassica cretica TaxID=69181 RepID=A0ABQ7D6M3_BRACR|nr:hypothetical protein DY000_02014881 [Brassica cretica]